MDILSKRGMNLTLRKGQKLINYLTLYGRKNKEFSDKTIVMYDGKGDTRFSTADTYCVDRLFQMSDNMLKMILELPDSAIEDMIE